MPKRKSDVSKSIGEKRPKREDPLDKFVSLASAHDSQLAGSLVPDSSTCVCVYFGIHISDFGYFLCYEAAVTWNK